MQQLLAGAKAPPPVVELLTGPEVTGEEGGPIRIELSAALDKIYGAEVPPAQLAEGKP